MTFPRDILYDQKNRNKSHWLFKLKPVLYTNQFYASDENKHTHTHIRMNNNRPIYVEQYKNCNSYNSRFFTCIRWKFSDISSGLSTDFFFKNETTPSITILQRILYMNGCWCCKHMTNLNLPLNALLIHWQ